MKDCAQRRALLLPFADSEDDLERSMAAFCPGAPAEVLARLARDSSVDVRKSVVLNDSVSIELLETLTSDDDFGVRLLAAHLLEKARLRKAIGEAFENPRAASIPVALKPPTDQTQRRMLNLPLAADGL
jgi:hypothetical protein